MKQLKFTGLLLGCLLYFAAPARAPDQKKDGRPGPSASRMRAVLDRIEGDTGVIYVGTEEAEKIDLPIKYLPAEIKGGTVLRITIEIDHAATQELRKNIERKQKGEERRAKSELNCHRPFALRPSLLALRSSLLALRPSPFTPSKGWQSRPRARQD